ncbi:MAG: N-acetylmuramoyl-L-alanine amidase [Myxococcota bacterium]
MSVKSLLHLGAAAGLATFALSCASDNDEFSTEHTPHVALAGADVLEQYARVDGYFTSPVYQTDAATRVAFLLNASRSIAIETQTVDPMTGRSSRWQPADTVWSEAAYSVLRKDFDHPFLAYRIRVLPDHVGAIRTVEIAASTPISGRLIAPHAPIALALSDEWVDAGVISRAMWGARPSNCDGAPDPIKNRIAVHFTAGQSTPSDGDFASLVRAVQAFHLDGRGWCDVGYHFLVDLEGNVYEGRVVDQRGSHVGGQNTGNLGIAFMGCFSQDPFCANLPPRDAPPRMVEEGALFLGAAARFYGIPIDRQRILGHSEHSGASTECPGDSIRGQLDRIVAIAEAGRTGEPARIQGVVFDASVTPSPAEPGNVRVVDALVECDCGEEVEVRAGDAFWAFDLDPGEYLFTARAPGYGPASAIVTLGPGESRWGSIGLVPSSEGDDTFVITVIPDENPDVVPPESDAPEEAEADDSPEFNRDSTAERSPGAGPVGSTPVRGGCAAVPSTLGSILLGCIRRRRRAGL